MTEPTKQTETPAGIPSPSSGVECSRGQPGRLCNLLFAVVVFCVALASFVQSATRQGFLRSPPSDSGDELGYERLGYNLACGLGFGYCPADRLPNSIETPAATCVAGCSAADFMVTAYRPPGFPVLIAAVYRFSPSNYFLVRLVNCICCALAVVCVAAAFARQISWPSGVCVGLLCSIDPRLREFAGTFLTENLATLALSLFALGMVAFLRRKNGWNAAYCGLALSALVFVRSFYVSWYPVLWACIAIALFQQARVASMNRAAAFRIFLIFCTGSVLLTGPWWIRNCVVLKAIMPTGTQGGTGIADGFSDTAYVNKGSWTPETANQIAAEIQADPNLQHITSIEFEKELCIRGFARAKAWIREHPYQVVQLTRWKLSRLWEFGTNLHTVLFSLAFLGMFVTRRYEMARVTFLLLILNSLTVMATYHTYERFMTPFRPLIHGMVGCGLEWLAVALLSRFTGFRHRRRRESEFS